VNPGIYKHRIVFQTLTTVKDGYGQPTDQWTNYKSAWADISPVVGREYFAVETINNEISHKIRLRYTSGILPEMRILYRGRVFSIRSVINYKEANIELQIMCKELV
jgi:SPP1 family predicted phage head-tail adaptor